MVCALPSAPGQLRSSYTGPVQAAFLKGQQSMQAISQASHEGLAQASGRGFASCLLHRWQVSALTVPTCRDEVLL